MESATLVVTIKPGTCDLRQVARVKSKQVRFKKLFSISRRLHNDELPLVMNYNLPPFMMLCDPLVRLFLIRKAE